MTVQTQTLQALDRAVESGAVAGAVAAVLGPGGEVVETAAGRRGVDNPAPMSGDTVFWIASCTKAITTVGALQLVERGLVGLDEPVGGRLPVLATARVLTGFDGAGQPQTRPAKVPITLRHLLTHTSGLAYDFFSADLSRYFAATGGSLFGDPQPNLPLLFEPGEAWHYGIGIDWAGQLIQAVTGQTLDVYLGENLTGPLGMTSTTFFPKGEVAARQASMHRRTAEGALEAMPFAMPSEPNFGMGGGGLYSTAGDYLTFLRAILGGGALGDVRILRPETVALMTSNQAGEVEAGVLKSAQPQMSNDFDAFPGMAKRWGLGFLLNQEAGPAGRSAQSLAWAGLANCYYWADPARNVAGVFLSQVLPFADPKVLGAFADVERAVYNA
jgi:CubicO group peptidase (beta-lactamase class C family)